MVEEAIIEVEKEVATAQGAAPKVVDTSEEEVEAEMEGSVRALKVIEIEDANEN